MEYKADSSAECGAVFLVCLENSWRSFVMANWFDNPLSQKIMRDKYLHEGEVSAEEFLRRVSGIFSEPLRDEVYELMRAGTFFPAGRSLYGAGSKGKFNATMSNCYIMKSPEDSLASIYDTNKLMATIFKSGGGIGVNISKLRPDGSRTNNAARTSTGAVSFIHLFNTTGEIIGFHGRRGATLVGLDVSHPDIEKFVDLRKEHSLKAMNISCLIDSEFMEAVKQNKKYKLHFYVDATGENIEREIDAKALYHHICEMNWDYGDPGMLFMDSVRDHNLQSANPEFKIEICNPCAEYTGPAFNSCNLGSLNLYHYVHDKFSDDASFDFDAFAEDVHTAVRALDEILDYGYDLQPLPENKDIITKWRAIGLGFFGLADAFVALKVKYGSAQSLELATEICRTLMEEAIYESAVLAKEKGTFGSCDINALLKSPIIQRLKEDNPQTYKLVETYGMRNAQLISIAPTGSLSLLADCASSGIEPIFKCAYERTSHGLEDQGIGFSVASRSILDLLAYNHLEPNMSSEEIKRRFPFVVETADIEPLDRVKIQASMQKYIDNAISSTVTLKESATVEDIEKIYMTAYELGLKGITVFRNNCKRASILGVSKKKDTTETVKEVKKRRKYIEMDSVLPINRATKPSLEGTTYRKRTACVKALYVTVNRDEDDNIFEVFINKSIHGCTANIATITRLASLALRSGVKVEKVVEELKSNTCQACFAVNSEHPDYNLSMSCPIAIGECIANEYKKIQMRRKLQKAADSIEKANAADKAAVQVKEQVEAAFDDDGNSAAGFFPEQEEQKDEISALECPVCHKKTLIPEGKCVTCRECGYSKCD